MTHDGHCLGNQTCTSDADYLQKYVASVAEAPVAQEPYRVVAVIEACCGAAQLADTLRSRGWKVDLAHPGYTNRLKKSPDKSDKQDAELLADLVRVGYVPSVWLPLEPLRQLHSLFRYRQQWADRRRQTKQRIHGLMRESGLRLAGGAWTRKWHSELQGRLAELGEQRCWIVQRELETLVEIDAQIKEIELRLTQATATDLIAVQLRKEKGVGLITAAARRAEIGDFGRFAKGKQLSRYCGLTPRDRSSGERQIEAGFVRAGNRRLRLILIEAAHRLARHEPRPKQLCDRLMRNGHSRNEAVVAVANRWVRWLHHRMVAVEIAVEQEAPLAA